MLPVNQKHRGWCLPTARPRPHFNQWCDLWQMDLNQSKCGLLSITRNASPFHFPYQLSDVKVKTMEAQKDLGDLVTKHLKWNSQVLATYSKANKMHGFLRRSAFDTHDQRARKLLYLSLVPETSHIARRCGLPKLLILSLSKKEFSGAQQNSFCLCRIGVKLVTSRGLGYYHYVIGTNF